MTGHSLRAAIAAACDLTNPRLSEVDWDEVAAAFNRMRSVSPQMDAAREALRTLSLGDLAEAWYRAFGEGDRSMTYHALTMERVERLRDELLRDGGEVTPMSIDRGHYGLPDR